MLATCPVSPVDDSEVLFLASADRQLQWQIPDYTSPPLPDAIEATPEAFRDDQVIDAAREAAGANNCSETENKCMIPFVPEGFEDTSIGVLWYGGALVDPRGYSPLANTIATRYGLPVLINIFYKDMPFVPCSTGRLDLAQELIPTIEKWVLVGHSFGGTAAMADLWTIYRNESSRLDEIAGLVLLASDLNPDIGCGPINFSTTTIPMGAVTASNDWIVNMTRWEDNRANFPANHTFFMDIHGGNHGGFGSYNYSERKTILGQTDGPLLIDPVVQFDLMTAVVQVASRSGIPLPEALSSAPSPSTSTSGASFQGPWAAIFILAWTFLRFV